MSIYKTLKKSTPKRPTVLNAQKCLGSISRVVNITITVCVNALEGAFAYPVQRGLPREGNEYSLPMISHRKQSKHYFSCFYTDCRLTGLKLLEVFL